jgi:hypothetical protein
VVKAAKFQYPGDDRLSEPNFPEPQSAAWNATKHGWVCYPERWSKSDNQKFD